MASNGSLAATVFRWRFVVAAAMTFLILILGAATVRSDDPEREFSFMGRATIDGEPAPESTLIEIEVKGKVNRSRSSQRRRRQMGDQDRCCLDPGRSL